MYDLPSPGQVVPVSPPVQDAKDVAVHGMGHDEVNTFEKTVGWAPRFGQGNMTEAEANESLLDHTTWIESKLDDKFFGGMSCPWNEGVG
jgi:hypothetical protein